MKLKFIQSPSRCLLFLHLFLRLFNIHPPPCKWPHSLQPSFIRTLTGRKSHPYLSSDHCSVKLDTVVVQQDRDFCIALWDIYRVNPVENDAIKLQVLLVDRELGRVGLDVNGLNKDYTSVHFEQTNTITLTCLDALFNGGPSHFPCSSKTQKAVIHPLSHVGPLPPPS